MRSTCRWIGPIGLLFFPGCFDLGTLRLADYAATEIRDCRKNPTFHAVVIAEWNEPQRFGSKLVMAASVNRPDEAEIIAFAKDQHRVIPEMALFIFSKDLYAQDFQHQDVADRSRNPCLIATCTGSNETFQMQFHQEALHRFKATLNHK